MPKFIGIFLYHIILIPISWLPFGVLYLLSDIFYFFVHYTVGYRRQVVRTNLRNSFPNLSDKELKLIERKFYRHFSDFLVESIKSVTISDKKIRERCKFKNLEVLEKYYTEGKDVFVICGHYNNWEYYAVGMAQQIKHKTVTIYNPLKDEYFNNILLKSRQRFGMKLYSMREFPKFLIEHVKSPTPTLSILINDQSPGNPSKAYWNTFLNQETAWMNGAEKLAKKYNQAVIFGVINKVKRGFYEVELKPITDTPRDEPENYIIEKSTRYLEDVIHKKPEYWLWSHRRWKHKRTDVNDSTEKLKQTHQN